MATRYINYNVDSQGVTPDYLMWGGVQHEHNATLIRYFFDEKYLESLGSNLLFRIDFSSDLAGYDPSENLTVDGDKCLSRAIPKKFTVHGGNMTVTLVVSKVNDGNLNEEIVHLPATVFFTASKRNESPIYTNLSAYEEHLITLISKAQERVDNAQALNDELEQKITIIEKDFVKHTEYADKTGNGGIVRIKSNYGIDVGKYDGQSPQTGDTLLILTASDNEIKEKTSNYKPITPANIDLAVKQALIDNRLEWTDEEKSAVRQLIGASEKSSVIVVDNATVQDNANDYPIPSKEALVAGETYRWVYYSSDACGWLVGTELPVYEKTEMTFVAENVEIEGNYYVGCKIIFPAWGSPGYEHYIYIYQDGSQLKITKNFCGYDVISIYR